MRKEDTVYLKHILESIRKIENYVKGLEKGEFMKNSLVQDAVIRNLEIIGEAAKNVSEDFKNKHKNIPWREIARMRDKLIHAYFGVDLNITWEVIKRDLPKLKKQINKILNE